MTESSMERFKNKGKGEACWLEALRSLANDSHIILGLCCNNARHESALSCNCAVTKKLALLNRRSQIEARPSGCEEGSRRQEGATEGGVVHATSATRRPDLDRHLLLL